MDQQFTTRRAFATFILTYCVLGYLNKADGRRRVIEIANAVIRMARYGVANDGVEYAYYAAAYGLGWAVETGRLDGMIEAELRDMNVRQLLMLIHEIRCNCSVIGEVPRFIINRYQKSHQVA